MSIKAGIREWEGRGECEVEVSPEEVSGAAQPGTLSPASPAQLPLPNSGHKKVFYLNRG